MNRIDLIRRDDARVVRIILAPNEILPKHFHSGVIELVVCLNGGIEVHEITNNTKITKLEPGKIHEISPEVVQHLVVYRIQILSLFLYKTGFMILCQYPHNISFRARVKEV